MDRTYFTYWQKERTTTGGQRTHPGEILLLLLAINSPGRSSSSAQNCSQVESSREPSACVCFCARSALFLFFAHRQKKKIEERRAQTRKRVGPTRSRSAPVASLQSVSQSLPSGCKRRRPTNRFWTRSAFARSSTYRLSTGKLFLSLSFFLHANGDGIERPGDLFRSPPLPTPSSRCARVQCAMRYL